jgi:hypothetical protein
MELLDTAQVTQCITADNWHDSPDWLVFC